MIVVIGNPALRRGAGDRPASPGGTAALVAVAAAAAGSPVQLVGRTGDDASGDELVLALGQASVGHAALQRVRRLTPVVADPPDTTGRSPADDDAQAAGTPAHDDVGLDAADVELAMRYLPEIRVVVIAPEVADEVASVAARAAGWSGATAIRILATARAASEGLPDGTIVLSAPASDEDGVFAALVGSYAAALDRGEDPEDAFRGAVDATGWEPANSD